LTHNLIVLFVTLDQDSFSPVVILTFLLYPQGHGKVSSYSALQTRKFARSKGSVEHGAPHPRANHRLPSTNEKYDRIGLNFCLHGDGGVVRG